jgi:hypothetical protein
LALSLAESASFSEGDRIVKKAMRDFDLQPADAAHRYWQIRHYEGTEMRPFIRTTFCFLSAVLWLLTLSTISQAQTVYVNCCSKGPGNGTQADPYRDLGTAINMAQLGSTLVLERGTYIEGRPITKKLIIKSAAGATARILRHASTQKLWQLTGERDVEGRNELTASLTESRFRLKGTDLGPVVEHNGRIYFLFGDTHSTEPFMCRIYNPNEPRPFNGDSIAWIPFGADPEQPLRLNFISKEGGYISPKVKMPDGRFISLGELEVPTGGFSVNGKMYVFFTTNAWREGHQLCEAGGAPKMGRSILARLDNEVENLFTYLYDVSCLPGISCSQSAIGKFINIAPVVVNSNDFPDLPVRNEPGVFLWASADYRKSPSTYLAYVSADQIDCRQCWWYAKTDSLGRLIGWTQNEAEATPLFKPQTCFSPNPATPCEIGELSVAWNPFLRKWLMLYNHGNPRGINYRVADTPWGPWSEPQILFDPACDQDRGYCYFMHRAGQEPACDNVSDTMFGFPRTSEYGGEYGPYVIPSFTKGRGTSTTIYYLMSTWNPYQVVLMRSTLKIENGVVVRGD